MDILDVGRVNRNIEPERVRKRITTQINKMGVSGPDYFLKIPAAQGIPDEVLKAIYGPVEFPELSKDEISETLDTAEKKDVTHSDKHDGKQYIEDSVKLDRATREMCQMEIHYTKSNYEKCVHSDGKECFMHWARCGDRFQYSIEKEEGEDDEQKKMPHICKHGPGKGNDRHVVVCTDGKEIDMLCDILTKDFKFQLPVIGKGVEEVREEFNNSKLDTYRFGLLVGNTSIIGKILGPPSDKESLIGRNYAPDIVALSSSNPGKYGKAIHLSPCGTDELGEKFTNSLKSFGY